MPASDAFQKGIPLQIPVRLNCVNSLNGHNPFLYIGFLYTVPGPPDHLLGGLSVLLGYPLIIESGLRHSVNSRVGEYAKKPSTFKP